MIDPFPRLEPPPGGLALLRERLDRPRGRRAWLLGFPIAAAAAVAAVLLMVPPSGEGLQERMKADPFAQALGLAPKGERVQGLGGTAVREVVTSSQAVKLYWTDAASLGRRD